MGGHLSVGNPRKRLVGWGTSVRGGAETQSNHSRKHYPYSGCHQNGGHAKLHSMGRAEGWEAYMVGGAHVPQRGTRLFMIAVGCITGLGRGLRLPRKTRVMDM
jgi:hypothetical protein